MKSLTTPNILEIAYLLDRHHRITGVTTQASWPYGISELAVSLEGEDIELDRANFMRHGECRNLTPLAQTFAAIQAIIDRQAEDSAFSGGER